MNNVFEEITKLMQGMTPATPEACHAQTIRDSIAPRMAASKIPLRYQCEIDFIPAQFAVVKGCGRLLFRRKGAIVALVGPRGTGKTSIATHIVRELYLEDHQSIYDKCEGRREAILRRHCRYFKLSEIVGRLKPLYADFGTTETAKLESFRDDMVKEDLLILDELSEPTSEPKFKDPILTDIIDRRYAELRDTILISNETPEQFQKNINPSVLSRMNESGGILPCEWRSFREAQ